MLYHILKFTYMFQLLSWRSRHVGEVQYMIKHNLSVCTVGLLLT